LANIGKGGRRPRGRASIAICALSAILGIVLAKSALADPPPWSRASTAAAENQLAYRFPAGLKDGRCRPEMFKGKKVGGLAGAARPSLSTSKSLGRRAIRESLDGTALGVLMAAVGGNPKSSKLSRREEICFSQSFEHVPDRRTVAWSDRKLGVHYSVIPMRTLRTSDDHFCREYAAKATLNGHSADVYGTACRQPDGRWFLVD